MLTDKAKQLFELWSGANVDYGLSNIDKYPLFMRFGVYQKWADSLGYKMNISFDDMKREGYFWWEINSEDDYECGEFVYETRPEAQKVAIENLNILINSKE